MLQDPVRAPRSAANILRLPGPLRPRPVLEALRRLTKTLPERTVFRLSLAYVQTLLKVDRSDVEATLARGEGAFSDKGLYRIVAMLAALDAGRSYDAARLLDGSDIDWSKAPAAWQAVRVATLARSGQNFAARQAAEGLAPSRLSLPEKALVADLLPKRRRDPPGHGGTAQMRRLALNPHGPCKKHHRTFLDMEIAFVDTVPINGFVYEPV